MCRGHFVLLKMALHNEIVGSKLTNDEEFVDLDEFFREVRTTVYIKQ